mgnify:FL=1
MFSLVRFQWRRFALYLRESEPMNAPQSPTYLMVFPVRRRNHWGRGRFCLIFLARIRLVRKDFCEGYTNDYKPSYRAKCASYHYQIVDTDNLWDENERAVIQGVISSNPSLCTDFPIHPFSLSFESQQTLSSRRLHENTLHWQTPFNFVGKLEIGLIWLLGILWGFVENSTYSPKHASYHSTSFRSRWAL